MYLLKINEIRVTQGVQFPWEIHHKPYVFV